MQPTEDTNQCISRRELLKTVTATSSGIAVSGVTADPAAGEQATRSFGARSDSEWAAIVRRRRLQPDHPLAKLDPEVINAFSRPLFFDGGPLGIEYGVLRGSLTNREINDVLADLIPKYTISGVRRFEQEPILTGCGTCSGFVDFTCRDCNGPGRDCFASKGSICDPSLCGVCGGGGSPGQGPSDVSAVPMPTFRRIQRRRSADLAAIRTDNEMQVYRNAAVVGLVDESPLTPLSSETVDQFKRELVFREDGGLGSANYEMLLDELSMDEVKSLFEELFGVSERVFEVNRDETCDFTSSRCIPKANSLCLGCP